MHLWWDNSCWLSHWLKWHLDDKWIYKNVTIGNASQPIFDSDSVAGAKDTYFGNSTREIASGDKIKWIAIKHTGTSDGSTVTTDGVNILLTSL